ncbi:MAG: hypothetical protein II674_09850 [Prevotella sp.]|nr:hypothetical protein [Prevotella sp.]
MERKKIGMLDEIIASGWRVSLRAKTSPLTINTIHKHYESYLLFRLQRYAFPSMCAIPKKDEKLKMKDEKRKMKSGCCDAKTRANVHFVIGKIKKALFFAYFRLKSSTFATAKHIYNKESKNESSDSRRQRRRGSGISACARGAQVSHR